MKEKTVYIDSQSDYEMLEDLIFDYAATLGQGKTVRVVFGKTELVVEDKLGIVLLAALYSALEAFGNQPKDDRPVS